MGVLKPNVQLKADSLSAEKLKKLKWCTTIAIIGFPILVQILGTMMLKSQHNPIWMSASALMVFGAALIVVLVAGLYAISNRVFLRFSGANDGLQEWESKTQTDAFAFSYRVITKGVLLGFFAISLLGALQLFGQLGWINFSWGQNIVLNIQAIAAIAVMLTYLVILLPTLFIAWTLKPLSAV